MSWFGNMLGWGGARDVERARRLAQSERIQQYGRYLRAYQGYSVRGVLNTAVVSEWKRLKFNFTRPIVDLSAGWFAAKPLDWDIDGDPEATKEAYRIWDRSGSDAVLLENATACGIYGDVAGIATQDERGRACIEFVDPCICAPGFDGADYSRLSSLEVAYEELEADGRAVLCREMWLPDVMTRYRGDVEVGSVAYDRLPAVWIRNSAVKGLPYGISDIEAVLELVEEYDHLASKQTRIVDYYASPHVVFSGVQKGAASPDNAVGNLYYLPTDAKAYFLEWSGSGPGVEDQLVRVRNAIAEVSQVPAVAFGQADGGLTTLSGVAIQILYGPLLNKTHRKQASWGPALQYLMWRCLVSSGHDVELDAVNVRFASGTPVDGQSVTAISSAKVAAKLASRRTEMNNQGIEDPDAELKRILIEERLLQLATPLGAIDQNANTAARAGSKGTFAQEVVSGTGTNKLDPAALTLTRDEDISQLLERADSILGLEHRNLG